MEAQYYRLKPTTNVGIANIAKEKQREFTLFEGGSTPDKTQPIHDLTARQWGLKGKKDVQCTLYSTMYMSNNFSYVRGGWEQTDM